MTACVTPYRSLDLPLTTFKIKFEFPGCTKGWKLMDKDIEKHDMTRPPTPVRAAGKTGRKPTWSSGAKTLVGTAASPRSRMWFTVGNGTLNELYFPDVDQANTRSVRFLVTDGTRFFSDEEWDAEHTVTWLAPGVPGCHIESKSKSGHYTIVKDIVTDPVRDTLMMRVHFTAHKLKSTLRLYLFQEPQMCDPGRGQHGLGRPVPRDPYAFREARPQQPRHCIRSARA